jgi:hypothetical protein
LSKIAENALRPESRLRVRAKVRAKTGTKIAAGTDGVCDHRNDGGYRATAEKHELAESSAGLHMRYGMAVPECPGNAGAVVR